MRRVGLIGVGVMGRTVAPRILNGGHQLHVFDVSKEALARVANLGVAVASSPEMIAERAEVVLMFLPGPGQVEEAVRGAGGLLAQARPGMIIVDLSTVDPAHHGADGGGKRSKGGGVS